MKPPQWVKPGKSSPRRPAFGLVLLVLLSGSLSLVGADRARSDRKPTQKQRVQQLRSRLKSLSKKKEKTRQQLRVIKRQQVRLADQLNDSYERLETAQQALLASAQRLAAAEIKVKAVTQRLEAAEQRLAEQRRKVGIRIAAAYREGPVTFSDVLLRSRNLSDFLDRQYYVSRVMAKDVDLLRDLREAQERVEAERRSLQAEQERLAGAYDENKQLLARYTVQANEREQLLRALRRERALQEQQLQELEEDSNEIQGALAQESARRQANPGAYRNLPRWTGKLQMPARGRITSRFGYRHHPILRRRRLHSGVDISGRTGAPVYAAESGEVFFASWRGGYGRCIILLHGGGMSTLYAHLSRIDVRPGQSIRRGQRIGAIGSTGLSTGPHLHFEVRKNGVPVNPL